MLCTTSFDHWYKVQNNLREITSNETTIERKRFVLPCVIVNAELFGNNLQAKNRMIEQSSLRMLPVFEKMQHDSDNRLRKTLKVLRACRLFNYKFVAETEIDALKQEFLFCSGIPFCYENLTGLESELLLYKERAFLRAALETPLDLWEFWCAESLTLGIWWNCAQEVSLITPSSCTIERAFSMLTNGFGNGQERALGDMVFTSVMIRYNNVWINK